MIFFAFGKLYPSPSTLEPHKGAISLEGRWKNVQSSQFNSGSYETKSFKAAMIRDYTDFSDRMIGRNFHTTKNRLLKGYRRFLGFL
jgi:hypothetical protein